MYIRRERIREIEVGQWGYREEGRQRGSQKQTEEERIAQSPA
jgi:hypothetical protein